LNHLVEAIVRPEVYEVGENIGQIGLGVDAVEFIKFGVRVRSAAS
jgi:hypothetical protein